MGESNDRTGAGRLAVVGIGPGDLLNITDRAREEILGAHTVVGYKTYLKSIAPLVGERDVHAFGMKQEVERCTKAIDLAADGHRVALVSSGDPGIYGMAGLVLELLRERELPIEVHIIPGVSALGAAAARLGAPLMHDFAVISLSDLLTPWELIEERLAAVARADFVIVLYNPASRGRKTQFPRARAILLEHRPPETPVGIVTAAWQEEEELELTTLARVHEAEVGMSSTVIIGNSQSFLSNHWIITPRGYPKI